MKRLERLLEVLTAKRWPVRWRLAAVSAVLTFLILVAFALVVGRLTQNRLHGDFNDDLTRYASNLGHQPGFVAAMLQGSVTPRDMALPTGARLMIVDGQGNVYWPPDATTSLGPPRGEVSQAGDFAVASAPSVVRLAAAVPVRVQYARPTTTLASTFGPRWRILGRGVLGGTARAPMAGIAVAGRAMRPIATLTSTARRIAAARDPSQRIPKPKRDDEVGELARPLDQMLRQLDAARSETEQLIQLQREFVADASHELRTPLTSVLANLELLQERLSRAGAATDEHEMVDSALRSSKRMSRLVSDLLLLARADAGRESA